MTIAPLCYRCCAGAGAFGALSPLDGAVNQPVDSVVLDWQDSPGASSYDLQFGTSPPPPLLRANLTASQDAVGGLAGGTVYYWTVEARAGCGTRAASGGERTFTTTSDPLEVPPDSVRVGRSGTDITVSWAPACGVASDYTIHEGDLDVLASTGTYSHVSKVCGDAGGDFMETFTPGPGNRYYLVVGRTASGVEGGYGFGRPQGADAAGCGITGFRPGTCP